MNCSTLKHPKAMKIASAAVVALAVFVYLGSLSGMLIWDDKALVSGSLIGGGKSLWRCFTQPFLGYYYRPMVSASFWLDLQLWGRTAFFFHQTNIILHALTTWVVIRLGLALFGSRKAALCAGALFAVQPLQVSAVAWIGGRTDALAALFMSLMLWGLVEAAKSPTGKGRKWSLLAGVSYTLAIFTKEQLVATLPLVPLAYWAFKPRDDKDDSLPGWRTGMKVGACLFGITVVFVGLWLSIGPPRQFAGGSSLADTLMRFLHTVAYYFELIVLPQPASLHTLSLGRFEAQPVLSILVAAVGIAVLCRLLMTWRKTNRPAFWLLAGIVLTLAPVANLAPMPSLLVAPYRAGVTGVMAALLMGYGLMVMPWRLPARLGTPDRPLFRFRVATASALFIWCTGLAVWGSSQWETEETIFTQLVRYDPTSIIARYNLTAALLDTRDSTKRKLAIGHLHRVLRDLYGSEEWRTKEGALTGFRREGVQRRVRSNQGNRVGPGQWLAEVFAQLGFAQLDDRDIPLAQQNFEIGSALSPRNHNAHIGLAMCLSIEGKVHQALAEARVAASIKYELPEVHQLAGDLYMRVRDWPKAASAYRRCIDLQPAIYLTYVDLAKALKEMGKTDEAIEAVKRVLAKDPNRTDAKELMAELRAMRKRASPAQVNREVSSSRLTRA